MSAAVAAHPHRAEFLDAGNRLCRDLTDRAESRFDRLDMGDPGAFALGMFEVFADTLRQERDGIRALAPPTGDEAHVDWIIGTYDPLLALIEPVVLAGGFRDEAQRAEFGGQLTAASESHDASMRDFGLTDCQFGDRKP